MIDRELLSRETQGVFSMLEAGELPETQDYLAGILGEDGYVAERPYAIASALMQCDRREVFPGFLLDYIEELFESEAAVGNDEAMTSLGGIYYTGSRGFPQNFAKAVQCYQLAAERGNRQAQENLGYCYYYGRAMPPDYKKAFHCFALGAFDGHLVSLYKIGDMYLNGYYVEKNEREAFLIYVHCAETMTEEAKPYVAGQVFLRLGRMFLNGIGTEQNFKNALVCFQKAELFLYDMVKHGDVMYRKSLHAAIEGQRLARAQLAAELPPDEWGFD